MRNVEQLSRKSMHSLSTAVAVALCLLLVHASGYTVQNDSFPCSVLIDNYLAQRRISEWSLPPVRCKPEIPWLWSSRQWSVRLHLCWRWIVEGLRYSHSHRCQLWTRGSEWGSWPFWEGDESRTGRKTTAPQGLAKVSSACKEVHWRRISKQSSDISRHPTGVHGYPCGVIRRISMASSPRPCHVIACAQTSKSFSQCTSCQCPRACDHEKQRHSLPTAIHLHVWDVYLQSQETFCFFIHSNSLLLITLHTAMRPPSAMFISMSRESHTWQATDLYRLPHHESLWSKFIHQSECGPWFFSFE